MYTLVNAYRRDSVVRNKWVEVEGLVALLATPVENINAVYGQVQLILVHNSEPEKKVRYDFVNLRREIDAPFNPTLGQWLEHVRNSNISYVPFKGVNRGKVYYADAIEAGFGVNTTMPNALPNNKHTDEVRSDVIITMPKHLTPELVLDNCLFTVAGYLHRPYATVNGVYLKDAGTTLNRSNLNTCGVLSFSTVGRIKTYPIKLNMLSALPAHGVRQRRLSQPVFVKLPDYNPTTQTAMLSLMGVLIPLGKTFKEVGDGLFEINLVQYNYLLAWMRAERILGFKQIKSQIEQSKESPTQLSLFDVAGREFVEGVLTCSQTFVITVENPAFYCEKIPMETSQNSMVFMHHAPVETPVVDSQGVMMDYLVNKEADIWTIDVPPSDLVNRRILTTPYASGDAVDSLADHVKQMKRNTAYRLEMVGQQF